MRRWFLVVLVMVFATTMVYAQKVQYGLRAGLGFASQSIENPDIVSTNSVTTYYISAFADIPVKGFYIQPGIGIVGKGVKEFQNAQTNTITLTYLDIPVTALYKFDLPTLGKLYVGAGPYASMGLSGNNQLESINTVSGSNVSFGNDLDYKKMDYGLNFTTGLELNNHLTLNMKYSLGLNNIASDIPTDVNTSSVKNRIFTIGLGFWL